MSDQKLRELERHWRETGSVEDEAAYLRERVRVGDLTQERLELAAYCGHEGAMICLGLPSLESPCDGLRLAKDLAVWGPDVLLWLAVLAIESLGRDHPELQRSVQSMRAWLESPTPTRLAEVREMAGRAASLWQEELASGNIQSAATARSLSDLAAAVGTPGLQARVETVGWLVERASALPIRQLGVWALDSARYPTLGP